MYKMRVIKLAYGLHTKVHSSNHKIDIHRYSHVLFSQGGMLHVGL